jgi:hypothetical protein
MEKEDIITHSACSSPLNEKTRWSTVKGSIITVNGFIPIAIVCILGTVSGIGSDAINAFILA